MLTRSKAVPVLSLFLAHARFSNDWDERAQKKTGGPMEGQHLTSCRESGQNAMVNPFSVERTVRSREVRRCGGLCRRRVCFLARGG